MRTKPQSPQYSACPPRVAVRQAVMALITRRLNPAEMTGMRAAIGVAVATEHLRHLQGRRHDGSRRRRVLQLQPVERALRAADRSGSDAGVAGRGRQVVMTQQRLDGANVGAGLE